jgi:hypothetical protein
MLFRRGAEADRLPTGGREFEIRCLLADLEHRHSG